VETVVNAPVRGNISSYPGTPLQIGSTGPNVVVVQTALNRISQNYPAIPKIPVVDGIYGSRTQAAVRKFQEVFNLTADGIVGRVTEVGLNWSKVTTIVEANSSVGAYVERTNDAGVCVGKFELSSGGLCELNYLPADSDVKVGDRVLSTGFGSVYPRGLVVGYVESVEVNPYTRALSVKVKCSSNFSTLTNVMVITSYETVAIDGSELTDN
jgi:rod shape-determining protein MreC